MVVWSLTMAVAVMAGSTSAYYYTTGARPLQWQNNNQAATGQPPSTTKWQQQQQPAAADANVMPLVTQGGLPPPAPPPPLPLPAGLDTTAFGYDELEAATGGFSEANLLGQGGFGYVHRGVLPDGTEVAVKQLKAGSGQGEREFQAEVDTISRVHHRHLVSLVGYCIAGARRLLVYEFVPNQTLEHHLHGTLLLADHPMQQTGCSLTGSQVVGIVVAGKGVPVMEWTVRLRIALGAAKGLAYLHEECT
jgi:hypothetical protein